MLIVPVKVCWHFGPDFWQCEWGFTLRVPLASMGYDVVQVHVGVGLLNVLLSIYRQVERINLLSASHLAV